MGKIHIVGKDFVEYSLRESFNLNNSLTGDIITLNDHLNVGPIHDLDKEEGVKRREEWLQYVLINNEFEDMEYVTACADDIEKIRRIKIELPDIKQICIWVGNNTFERLMLARLMYELKEEKKDILIVPISEHKVTIRADHEINPTSMVQLNPKNISSLASKIRRITQEEINLAISNWQNVKDAGAIIRSLSESGKVEIQDETFFDKALLSECKNEFLPAARIIGETLCNLDFEAPDTILNWRLKELAKNKKLGSKGILRNIRDYEIKKIS